MSRILRAAKRRPVRLVEAAIGLAAALGVTLAPETRESVTTLVATLAPAVLGIVGGEAAQTKTRPLTDWETAEASHSRRLADAADGNPPEPSSGDPDLPPVPEEV